jgi:hypothetical protein
VVVYGCVTRSNSSHGIYLWGTGNQVAFCSTTDNGGYGIYMFADSSDNISHSTGANNVLGNVINCGVGNGCHHNMLP